MTTTGGAGRRFWATAAAAALVVPALSGCAGGPDEAAPDASSSPSDSATCAQGRVDALHEAFRPATDGISMDYSTTPEELLRQADGIAVVALRGLGTDAAFDLTPGGGEAARRYPLEVTVLRGIKGAQAGDRMELAWRLLGADPAQVARALPEGEVLVAWQDESVTPPVPAGETPKSMTVHEVMLQGPWYELPATECLPAVVTTAMWGAEDRVMEPWGTPESLADMEEALRDAG